MAFAQRLYQLRKMHNLTQEELARKLGLSQSTIGMYEHDLRRPDFEGLEVIADFFKVDMDYLFGRNVQTPRVLDSEQLQVINAYNELTDDQKVMVRRLLNIE